MKIKATHTVEAEIEISMPYFFKHPKVELYFALLSEKKGIVINENRIEIYNMGISPISQFIDGTQIEVTAEQFTLVFDKQLELFGQIIKAYQTI